MKRILFILLLLPFITSAQNQKIYGIGLWQYQAYTSTANGTASLLKTGKMTNTATTTHLLYGANFSDTLLSGANTQGLYGMYINPTFTTGANTNVDRVTFATSSAGQVRLASDLIPTGNANWAGTPSLGGTPQYIYGYSGSGTLLFSNAYTYNSQDAIFIGAITTTGSAYRSIGLRADYISLNTIGGGGVMISDNLSHVAASKLEIAGSFGANITTITTTTTLDATHYTILVDASGGNVTVNLPDAATCTRRIYNIKLISATNSVIVDGSGSQTIDGATTATLSVQYLNITIQSNGTNWSII